MKDTELRVIAIVGPTASGKSELAVSLAKKFNGEIVSADSRQIYKGLDLGTGKVPGIWRQSKNASLNFKGYWYKNIRHHCIDYIDPKKQYSVSLFQRDAQKSVLDILKRHKLPIICGGSAHWVDALLYDQPIPEVKPNIKLRARLEKLSALELWKRLKKLNKARAENIDLQNKRRLIRALEIVITTGKPIPDTTSLHLKAKFKTLWLGINPSQKILYQKIDKRLKQRLNQGMIEEVRRLHKKNLSWQRLMDFGLEYRHISQYLQEQLPYQDMLTKLSFAIKHYSKRQLTWWKRNKDIIWLKNKPQAIRQVKKFLA